MINNSINLELVRGFYSLQHFIWFSLQSHETGKPDVIISGRKMEKTEIEEVYIIPQGHMNK